jgi:hypothetical protein
LLLLGIQEDTLVEGSFNLLFFYQDTLVLLEVGKLLGRDKVQELSSKGHSQIEIAKILNVGLRSVNRDLTYIRQQVKNKPKKYIDERLPEEYEKCLVGLNAIVKEAWNSSQQTQDRREKIQALFLAKECYGMKLDLLTNATVVDHAIRFVTEHGKSTNTVSSEVGSTAGELKPKINTVEDIQDAGHAHHSSSTTTNQVF